MMAPGDMVEDGHIGLILRVESIDQEAFPSERQVTLRCEHVLKKRPGFPDRPKVQREWLKTLGRWYLPLERLRYMSGVSERELHDLREKEPA